MLNPISVMPLDSGQYQLLAGLRRLKACAALGIEKVMVNVISIADTEHALRIEFSENEQREDFTFSKKMDYAALFEEIEKAKTMDRKTSDLKQNDSPDKDARPYRAVGQVRDIVGYKIGVSGRQYERARYAANNAPTEVIKQIDGGKTTIYSAYNALKTVENTEAQDEYKADSNILSTVPIKEPGSKFDDRVRKLKSEKLAINPYYSELKNKYEAVRYEANAASSRMRDMEINHKNQVYHLENINSMLDRRVEALEAALSEANIRILALGGDIV